ncbi:MAG: cobalamin-dependent protein [Caldisericia bacterium]|nr:cobalamin-dependent protein [Caldisericia bacterium]
MLFSLRIYEEFQKLKDLVLSETNEKLKTLLPENFKTQYLENVTKRDLNYNYDHLAVSVSYNDRTIFVRYLNWLKILFDNYNLNFKGVLTSYEILLDYIKKYFERDLALKTEEIYNTSLKEYNQIKEEEVKTKLEDYFTDFLNYSLNMEKDKAFELINSLLKKGINIKDIYLEIFQKTLYKIGELWQKNKITVAHEHYVTNLIQWIISRIYREFLTFDPYAPKIVVICSQNELHELGARMVADFLEFEGMDTIFIGSNTPIDAIIELIKNKDFKYFALSATLMLNLPNLQKLIELIKNIKEDSKIIVGGRGVLNYSIAKGIGADGFGSDASQAVDVIKSFLN